MVPEAASGSEILHRGFQWRASDLDPHAWRLSFPAAAVEELDRALAGDPAAFDAAALPTAARFMQQVRERLSRGPGIAVTGGLPLDAWGPVRAASAVTVLAPLLAPLMHQTRGGRVYYEVRDTGAIYRPGVRRSITNAPQPFHTDGPWLARTPQFIGLHCMRPSTLGGESRCLSIETLLDDLETQAPEHVERLGAALPWHRQREHMSGDAPVSHHPLWQRVADGRESRLYTDYVHSGARAERVALDREAVRALDALEELAIDPDRWLRLMLQRGETLWLNNRRCAHARTGFDSAGGDRLLIRTWHRDGCDPRLDA